MKIIISPAKKMINECNYIQDMTTPIFLNKTKQLLHHLQQLSYEELKKLYDDIVSGNFPEEMYKSLYNN